MEPQKTAKIDFAALLDKSESQNKDELEIENH